MISYLPRYSGWLDYVLTDGSYRRREVIRCQTVGEELRLTFTGVPYTVLIRSRRAGFPSAN